MAMQQTLTAVQKYYESVNSILRNLTIFQNTMGGMLNKLMSNRGKFVFEWENYKYEWNSSGTSQLSIIVNSTLTVLPTAFTQAGQCQFMTMDHVYKLACNLKVFHKALTEKAFEIFYEELSNSCEDIKESAVADLI